MECGYHNWRISGSSTGDDGSNNNVYREGADHKAAVDGGDTAGGGRGRGSRSSRWERPRWWSPCYVVVRILALAFTLGAAVVLGLNRETEVVPVSLFPDMAPVHVRVPAKWHYLSAFVYFVVVNAIACAYAALSLGLSLVTRRGNGKKSFVALMMIITLDAVMVALVSSGSGAAGAVGVIGYNGNSHVQWNKVCNVFDKFCHQVAVAVLLSLLGAIAFLLLVVLAASSFYKQMF
ncbi:CASP-like protein 1E1 [Malania oleifera]|uniref:CASP-like protein 1E1 n=1 Tax=Malania oleifera TaxID=397392 RepID=UPI0025AE6DEA|nr:CASP-like protein 1E1 [Malania oleifera]